MALVLESVEPSFLNTVCEVTMPSYDIVLGLLVFFKNYWIRQRCETSWMKEACVLKRIDPCCKGDGSGVNSTTRIEW